MSSSGRRTTRVREPGAKTSTGLAHHSRDAGAVGVVLEHGIRHRVAVENAGRHRAVTDLLAAKSLGVVVAIEERPLRGLTGPPMPPSSKENDSMGLPRCGGSNASSTVRLVPGCESNCMASSRLLLAEAFAPNSATGFGNETSMSRSDL